MAANNTADVDMMGAALAEALTARELGEVPVGAVVVRRGTVLASAHNRRELDSDPTAHAELLAIRSAAHKLGTWRLDGCDLYVTLEPCPMCAGATILSRIRRLVYGAPDPKGGACGSLMDILAESRWNHRVEIVAGVLENECAEVLRRFFQDLREPEG
jgi:tRNA(adenine34) deaminase